jgi:large subunit ribosomal protein L30
MRQLIFKFSNQQIFKFTKMATIKIKQVKSGIGHPLRQKRTLEALGFRRLNQVIEKEVTPQVSGMLAKVAHLVVEVK